MENFTSILMCGTLTRRELILQRQSGAGGSRTIPVMRHEGFVHTQILTTILGQSAFYEH